MFKKYWYWFAIAIMALITQLALKFALSLEHISLDLSIIIGISVGFSAGIGYIAAKIEDNY